MSQQCFFREVLGDGVPPKVAEGERVNYERFKSWLLQNKEAFTFSRWLLSGGVCVTLTDDSDTPTFYQTLAGVTHLEESDIIDLEKRYWLLKAQSRTGRFDLETFVPLVSPPIHASLSEVCFKVFDVDRDGVLSRQEIQEMVVALLEVWKDNRTDALPLGHLTLEDYQIWSVKSALANEFLNLLFQVCHIVLGLRPASSEEEGQIIRGWLERESRHGLGPGQNWFLISMQWWQQWKDYVKFVSTETNKDLIGPGVTRSSSSLDERLSDTLSSASEATESPNNSECVSSATDICFARQHNVSDNNNQCFSSHNGHLPAHLALQRPGAIDNQPLVHTEPMKAPTLTMEGGRLKKSPQLLVGRDFETVPEPVWRALYHWYGANLSLPRPVILQTKTGQAELELFPRYLLFLRQQPATRTPQSNIWVNMGNVPSPNAPLKRVLAYTGCFSRMATIKDIHEYLSQRLRIKDEDMRLWLYNSEVGTRLAAMASQSLIIHIHFKGPKFKEKQSMGLALSRSSRSHTVPTEKGATGLSNLGNTCFMNSSIQCVSNTKPLTDYFISGRHLYELNRTNPIGMRGHMAKCYGDLVQDLWSGTQKNIAPLKLRWTIAKYAPRFNGFQQQDSQELLAFLLDGLHEDLNRVHEKPYVELKDSDGRPDWEVASEAWENHLRRNRSIVVDLFHGQLKSQVKCKTCGHISARFDPFNFLSLPLPMDSSMHLEITVIKLDGSTPVRYGLRLNMDEKYTGLKKQLSELCGLKPEQLLLAEVHSSNIKNFPLDNQKVRLSANGFLCAFEIPVPGSPTSVMSPAQTGEVVKSTSLPNGHAFNGHIGKPTLIPNGTPCTPERLTNGIPNGHVVPVQDNPVSGYIIAMHRKMMRTELYFLSSQKNRPSLFGMPLIVPCTVHTSKKDLYDAVWIQVSRLASPLPPQEASNHAQDCDDSMGYQYPFTLRVVQKDGNSCAWCPWYRFCRGCTVDCSEDRAAIGNAYIAIDWDPTALHLRYQTSQERIVEEHPSVDQSRRAQAEPISLDSCLRAFTGEEELGEDELYYCSKCKTHRLATKKLDLWRLPAILIVHLKRFQFVNGRWIKSQKIVKFPREGFDPSAFLAPREAEKSRQDAADESLAEELHKSGGGGGDSSSVSSVSTTTISSRKSGSPLKSSSPSPSSSPKGTGRRQGRLRLPQLGSRHRLCNSKESLDSSSKETGSEAEPNSITAEVLGPGGPAEATSGDSWSADASSSDCDVVVMNGLGPEHGQSCVPAEAGADPETAAHQRGEICLEPIYNLYAISCHSGIMGGGHYVTYAKNPNEKWYCYNDSSCKELHSEEIDTDSAYILFYEQQGVDYSRFLPKIDGKKMADTTSMDEDFESDYKKYCVLQ
uniref:ubiquitinyl hydrolase 1 n=1 Tax=Denticeps clupeoides TaxID=299321 RepID=A0AAY4DKB7_9TELE